MAGSLEKSLQSVNGSISLPEKKVKRNNEILEKVVDLFIKEMKKDPLFKELFQRVFYGGSFYDGLRIKDPNEFDLDLLLRIPANMYPQVKITNIPGFVDCKIFREESRINATFLNMIDMYGFIKATSVREWMESITIKALNNLCPTGILKVLSYTFKIDTRKSGPAMTIYLQEGDISIDIDFIPCFVFYQNEWPRGGYRSNPSPNKREFFIVPKTPKRENLPSKVELLWRLSFQEQEREMIDGKRFLKPALKLLKRLRDQQDHHLIASYYIKTIFLWEVEEDTGIFNSSLTGSFLTMLDRYIEWLEKREIPYFWNTKNNLLVAAEASTLQNYANRLKNIRRQLDGNTIYKFMGV